MRLSRTPAAAATATEAIGCSRTVSRRLDTHSSCMALSSSRLMGSFSVALPAYGALFLVLRPVEPVEAADPADASA